MQNKSAETSEKVKGISIRVLIVLAVSVLFIIVLFFLTNEIVLDNETSFDERVFQSLAHITSSAATRILTFFTFFGSINFLLPAYILLSLYFILFRKNTVRSFNVTAIGLSSGILLHLIKNIFQRHRPLHPLIANVKGFSYPSGHSFSSFTFAGLLIYMLWKSDAALAWKYAGTVLLFIFAAVVAFSRVYLHVHYASDVIAGFCLSFLWLTLCIWVLQKVKNDRRGRNASW